MIPQHAYRCLACENNNQNCDCDICVPMDSDWSELSNTEKLAKMIILKAQIVAEYNASKIEP